MLAKLPTIAAFAMLGGCATLSELVDDPSVEHSRLDKLGHVIMTAREDNRLIRTTYSVDGRLQLCAETQADAISARSASSKIDVTGKGSIEDEITRELTLTYTRTEVSDVVRQIAWQLCNANLNGQISAESYEASLRALQTQAMTVLASRQDRGSAAVTQNGNQVANNAGAK